MPDLSLLKIYVARLDTDEYVAGFTNSGTRPSVLGADDRLDDLFQPYSEQQSAGLIEFPEAALSIDQLAAASREAAGSIDEGAAPPELVEAIDGTRVAAGRRPTGQGRRQNAAERRVIELRAMEVGRERLETDGWSVTDVSAYRPYDFDCARKGKELHVEVKGTTGDGSSVLVTPGEVKHAREQHPDVALIVVSNIELGLDAESGAPTADEGQVEIVFPWDIEAHGELRPIGYEYRRQQ